MNRRLITIVCLLTVSVTGCNNGGHAPAGLPSPLPSRPDALAEAHDVTMEDIAAALDGFELSAATPPAQPLLIIGLDGITPFFFSDLLASGKLPNLQQLIDEGASGVLRSSVIPSSVVAWTSAVTGFKPAGHAMVSFFRMQPDGSLGLIDGRYRRRKAIWEYLTREERSAIVINVPGSYPPDPVNGLMIGGLLSPAQGSFTHPPELSPALRRLSYFTSLKPMQQLMKVGGDPFSSERRTADINEAFTITFNRAKVGLYLYARKPVDLFFIVFTLTDRLQHARHIIPGEMLDDAYINLDRIVGQFLRRKPAGTPVLVFSDHGFTEYTRAFAVNRWLAEIGLLTHADGQVHMDATRVFAIDTVGNYLTLRLNVRDREDAGVVPVAEVPLLLAKVRDTLHRLVDPVGGTQVVDEIVTSFRDNDDAIPYGPDMTVVLNQKYMATSSLQPPASLVRLDPPVFDHHRDGFYVLAGPGIRHTSLDADIQDIAPTTMYLLGLPIPADCDGRCLTELIDSGSAAVPPPRLEETATERDALHREVTSSGNEVMEYLRSLGYVR
ncbi:alkaline phosphatase family protein [bacterium]|nr:alkaline phosphatase family protein [candidate division CSSED10-310 bacterium]